jgi:hypothetical protein
MDVATLFLRESRRLPQDLLSHRQHLGPVIEPVTVDGMAPRLELPRVVPPSQRRLAHSEDARRFLDSDDGGLLVALSRHVDGEPTNLDQGRQAGVLFGYSRRLR